MRFRYLLAPFLLALLFAGPASARGTLDSILPEIRAEHPGRLSDAEPWTDSEGRTHYRIKWLTPEGRILFFNADADTGRFSRGGDGEYRDGGGQRWNGRHDDEQGGSEDDGGGRRSHWNGDGGASDWRGGNNGDGRWNGGGGRWNGNGGNGGDWHDRHGGDQGDRGQGGGRWRDGGRNRGNDN